MRVEIRRASETTKAKPYGIGLEEEFIFLRDIIYNNLKSPIKNLSVKLEDEPTTSYSEFIQDMSALHDSLFVEGSEVIPNSELIQINEYLGSLGIDNLRYPIKKDIIQISKFINADYEPYKGD